MTLTRWLSVAAAVFTLALAACTSSPYYGASSSYPPASTIAYGTVESIEATNTGSRGTSGLGAAAGAVAGGLLGHQIGSGSGNTAATIGGAVAGGIVGNEVEKRTRGGDAHYRVRVRLDNGTVQVLNQDDASNLRVGSRVRVENGRAYPL